MKRPEVSISFLSHPYPYKTAQQIEAVKDCPFDGLSIYEDLGYPSPHGQLLQFVQKCSRIGRFGIAGNVVARRQSMDEIVGQASELYNYSHGMSYVGLVPGAWMEQVGLKPAGVAQMREAIESFKYLSEKRTEGYNGKYYKVKSGFTVNYHTYPNIPIQIGAWGERMLALAGELADEVKVGGSANPEMVPVIKKRLQAGTEAASRKVEDIGITFGAVTVVDEDRQTALNIAKRKAAVYIDVIGEKDPEVVAQFPAELFGIKTAMAQGDIESAIKCIPDTLMDKFMFAGTPQDIIKQTEILFDHGVNRVEFGSPHGRDEIQGIHLLGKKVLPYFKA